MQIVTVDGRAHLNGARAPTHGTCHRLLDDERGQAPLLGPRRPLRCEVDRDVGDPLPRECDFGDVLTPGGSTCPWRGDGLQAAQSLVRRHARSLADLLVGGLGRLAEMHMQRRHL